MRSRRWAIAASAAAAVLLVLVRLNAQEPEAGKAAPAESLSDAEPGAGAPAEAPAATPAPAEAPSSLAEADAGVVDATAAVQRARRPAAPGPEAWPVRDTTPPDLGPYQLTLHSDGVALVRRQEAFDLHAGDNTLTVSDVARRLLPSSVRLRPLEDPARFTVLEQASRGGSVEAQSLLLSAVGQEVRLRDGRYTTTGKLLAVDDQGVIVESGGEIHIHPAGEVIVPSRDGLADIAPGLEFAVQTETAGTAQSELSYLAEGLSWSADYALTVREQDRLLSFDAWVTVANESGAGYRDVALLFATTPARPGAPAPGAAPPAAEAAAPGTALTAAPAPAAAPPVAASPAAPPQRYWLPRRVSLPEAGTTRFMLAQVPAARSAVRYVATLGPTGPVTVRLAAELPNTAAAGLGLPLPPGPVRFYAPDRVGRLQLLREASLAAVSADAPLRFDLGPSDDVQVRTTSTPVAGGLRRVVRLRNLRTEEVRVKVVEQRPGTWTLAATSAAFTTPAGGSAAAEVTVPANGAAEVRYEVRTGAAAPAAPAGRTRLMLIRVAHSPDADDAFMFYALAKGCIDTGDREYQHELQDIETLNRWAFEGRFELTAASIHAYAYLADKYALLASGASMGEADYGPRLVARRPVAVEDVAGLTVAVPGTLTSAYLVLKLLAPEVQTVTLPFDTIPEAVATGEVEAGLLIHEAQLTYGERKLHLVLDFGAWWHERHALPLPLGGNLIRRDLGPEMMRAVGADLKASIQYALDHREDALDYALQFAGDLDRGRADTFVGMYVNERSVDYGEEGREAVRRLLREGYERGVITHAVEPEFIA